MWRAVLWCGGLWACGDAECDQRVAAAEAQAGVDAQACVFAPDELAEPDCSRTDVRPLLGYYATWCNAAALACVQADTDANGVCFGNP